jgi:hypothetical protein
VSLYDPKLVREEHASEEGPEACRPIDAAAEGPHAPAEIVRGIAERRFFVART